MKKRILSLLCVLALCLGLLPTAALAAETNTVYVGGVALAGSSDSIVYATTNENGEVITEGATADNYNIKWDGSTLTLRNATIKKELYASDLPLTNITGAAIGVLNQSEGAELTIQLESSNTIENVSYGIYVHAPSTGSANLAITGGGTLFVNSNSGPIFVISSNGNAALGIKNAKVTATSSYGNGVTVRSGNSENSSASLTVNGGSLTATAQSSGVSGILLRFGTSGTSDGTPTVTVSNNAIVRANGSAGGITSNSSTGVQTAAGTDGTGGIVWNGSEGTVYGSVTLQEDITISEGESLTIGDGASLDTNGNTITVESGGKLEGTPNGTVVYAPTITTESLPDGEVGTAYNQPLTATGDAPITWTVSGTLPDGLSLDAATGIISGTPTTEETSTFTVTATNNVGSASKDYTLTIKPASKVPVTSVKLDKTELPLVVGGTAKLTATVQPDTATDKTVTWESSNPDVATVVDGKVTAVAPGTATITVKTADGGYTDTCTVTVTQPVTGVTLDTDKLSLFTGENKTLTATVQPDTATDKTVTWESSDADIVTVTQDPQDGAKATVTAKAAGEAAITVKTADGSYTDTCTVKVTQSTYGITSDTAELGFGSAYTDYDRPAAQTVTITNTGNRSLTLTQPASTDHFEVGTLSKTELAPDEKATFTVQPKADLAVGSYHATIKVTGSNGSNAASADVSASFTVVNIHDSSVKTSLTITPDVSAGIPGTAFTTAEKVKSELTRILVQDASYTAADTAFYDVKMQYSLDGGQTWFEATEATFPTEGITVTLPYPSGTGKDTHNFRVVHMFTVTSNRLGTTAGNTETPAVTKTDSGLQVTLQGLSPVVIGWDKIETQSSTGSAASAPADDTTYYTCPACGYHNWTATQAGYRCDNCGYLESVKQLSGYGNVKGTYTPGSGAAASAASTVPQTGDESNPVLWTVLLLVSGLALGGLAIAKRKKQ